MPTGKKGKGKKPNRKTKPPGPLSDCKLPKHVVLNILSRLPVKNLLQFRSVCKPWKSLIRSPKLIALHLSHHHSSATSPSLLLKSVHKPTLDNKFSLFSLQPLNLTSRADVDHSFPVFLADMDVVGTHNGVVCICQPPVGEYISIFNPATKHFLPVPSPPQKPDRKIHERVSVGFGFDPVRDCYKVIRICSAIPGLNCQSAVQVYSTDLGVWRKIEVKGPKIILLDTKSEMVVKGTPYWFGFLEDEHGTQYSLLWFDVHKEEFCHLPMLINPTGKQSLLYLVDWKGEFAMLGFPKREKEAKESPLVDVWVIQDDGTGVDWWKLRCIVGPIWGMKYVVGCSRNGQIVGVDRKGDLFMYDPETGGVEKFGVDGQLEKKFLVFNHRESLVSFKGEVPLRKNSREKDMKIIKNSTGVDGKYRSDFYGDHLVVSVPVVIEDGSSDESED